ncbi:chaplin [Streptomyces sp. NPDC102259]|uniref:chaplin n=1 Tax=Streptomyces sp. NPDC102259 TaxID=3366148 RepID=UPI00382FC92A
MNIAKKAAVALTVAGIAAGASAGAAVADAGAEGAAVKSPGVASGNVVQIPVHVPINLCGNTINVVGLLNPAFGNTCIND